MSLEGLKNFNVGYGFPFHKEARFVRFENNNFVYESKRRITLSKLLLAIPFLLIIRLKGFPLKEALKESPVQCSRAILAATIVGLPIIFALDIIATLFTQPIGRALEKRAKQVQLNNGANDI
ncbi:MAG: hypothetical protein ACK5MA_05305 [Parachlamydiaceae bacterium]